MANQVQDSISFCSDINFQFTLIFTKRVMDNHILKEPLNQAEKSFEGTHPSLLIDVMSKGQLHRYKFLVLYRLSHGTTLKKNGVVVF